MVSFSTKTLCIFLLLISHAHAAQWELLLSNEEAGQFTEKSGVTLTEILISPHNPDLIYVLSNSKLYKTENAGQSWLDASQGITGEITTLTMNPQQPNILYLATYDEVAQQGYLFKSTDAGILWIRNLNYLDSFIDDIVIHPHDTDIMYLSNGSKSRLLKSQDAGDTWQPISSAGNTFERSIARIILNPHHPQTLYAVHTWSMMHSTSPAGVYKSIDGGLSWINQTQSDIDTPLGTEPVAINPQQPNIIYVAESGAIRVRKSLDGGDTWQVLTESIYEYGDLKESPVLQKLYQHGYIQVESIALDPQNPDIVYIGGRPGFYRSADGGQNWQKFTPPDAEKIYTNHIAIDPHHPKQVYITTELKGLYRLTVDSECTARYDATTQQVAIPCLKLDDTLAEWSAMLQQKETAPQFEVLNVLPK